MTLTGLATDAWWFWAGIAAALLCFAQLLYPLRRRLTARPFGTAARALRFHVYGSLTMFVLVLAHAGLQWPAGLLGRAMLTLSIWSVASGLTGVWIQRLTPPRLLVTGPDTPEGRRLQALLRAWVVAHVPPAMALVGLLVWHIFAVVYY